jgi:hypothetical protein
MKSPTGRRSERDGDPAKNGRTQNEDVFHDSIARSRLGSAGGRGECTQPLIRSSFRRATHENRESLHA